ncbi:MAG: shikimate kinase [Balneolaceae bacterium]
MRQKEKLIFLCGMMGSGKTTIGKVLAEKLALPFSDLDDEIVKREQALIPEIFSKHGEEYFRERERRTLEELSRLPAGVVALGGGALQNREITEGLKQQGRLIFLDAPISVLLSRLQNDKSRPLLNRTGQESPAEKLQRLYRERRPRYAQAHITIRIGTESPAEIAEAILVRLKDYER